MKRLVSLAVIFSLFLSSCSTLTDITSDVIDGAADAAGVSGAQEAEKAIKKAVISDKKQWDGGVFMPTVILFTAYQKLKNI